MVKNGMCLVHPGEILREEYIVPMGMRASTRCRRHCACPPRGCTRSSIIAARSHAHTALRLARYFGTDAQSSAEPATELRFEDRRSGTQGQDRARSGHDGGVA